ncbi:MAG: PAS domain-containing sensor histidine kinase [Candidatus Micrarchaeia archaeon]
MKFIEKKTPEQKQQQFKDYVANSYRGKQTPWRARVLHPKMYFAAKMMDACEAPAKAVMEHAEDLIFHISPQGAVLTLSDSYLRTLGYGKEDLIGKNAFSIVHPDDVKTAMDAFTGALASGQSAKAEMRVMKKDGGFVYMESSGSVIRDAGGKIIGGLVINRDITERKNTEAELDEAVRQLTESVEALNKFFNIIAHDLRSPFQAFFGGLEMLTSYVDDLSKEEIKAFAEGLRDEAKNIYGLLENLLSWSRIKNGTLNASPEALRLRESVNVAIAPLEAAARNKGIAITNLLDGEAALADKEMFGRIIHNLVSNAIKFTPKGGEISIFAVKAKEGFVGLVVKDSGVGMGSEKLAQMFKPGVKPENGTEKEKGAGVGLLLVKEFVEKNGGKIEAESELGKGTAFIVTLPAVKSGGEGQLELAFRQK